MKTNYNLNTKQLGFIILTISIALFLIILSSTYELMKATNNECKKVCDPETMVNCPHSNSIPLQSYLGFSIIFVLAGIGIFLIFNGKKHQEELTEKEKRLQNTISKLKEDEKKIYELIKENEGAIFQSELVKKSNFSKVKVTRILDRLESIHIIERRRRGMTNLILLKY